MDTNGVQETVKEKYGEVARRVMSGETNEGCCGAAVSCCGTDVKDPITTYLYSI